MKNKGTNTDNKKNKMIQTNQAANVRINQFLGEDKSETYGSEEFISSNVQQNSTKTKHSTNS